jgi:hypothetical protein
MFVRSFVRLLLVLGSQFLVLGSQFLVLGARLNLNRTSVNSVDDHR